MQLTEVHTLTEMAKSASCPKCGYGPMSKTHYYMQGKGWQCSPTKAKAYIASLAKGGAAPATTPTPAATPAPSAKPAAPAAKPQAKATVQQPATTKPAEPAVQQPVGGNDSKGFVKLISGLKEVKVTENVDGSVDISGDVDLGGKWRGSSLPVKIAKITGDLHLSAVGLTTLEGCPEEVGDDFFVTNNKLTSFVGGPRRVGGSAVFAANPQVSSLEGLPSEVGTVHTAVLQLRHLSQITSLAGIHKIVKMVNGEIDLRSTPVKSNILGLLFIRKLEKVLMDDDKVATIINKHLAGERDAHECQEELMDAGFDDFAGM